MYFPTLLGLMFARFFEQWLIFISFTIQQMICWSCNEFSSDTCEFCEYRLDRPSHEEVKKTQASKQ